MVVAVVGLAICGGCAAERSNVRFGSLAPARRTLVSVEVRYTVGNAEDPPGKAGLAHLVEHLMFERKSQDGHGKLSDRIEQASLARNASTLPDRTHYYAIGLADKRDDLLAIDLERMASGCKGIDQATLAHERALVIDDIAQKHVDDVAKLHGALFRPGHGSSA